MLLTVKKEHTMKSLKTVASVVLAGGLLIAPLVGFAAEKKKQVKPYPLSTCVVSGEKLDSMGKPYVFVHEGQEIKLCCKGCLPDFKKDPAKYLKKIEEAEKKGQK